ncbi:MAG: hypothetical protein HY520_02495 [Candidatus Aenigmarchaeota archaeon]|nr:hypothetical protein [Candidatus Aenigmarchaeota archaeon]
MKLLIGDGNNIDFNDSIQMTQKQKQDFISFLSTQFAVVEEEQYEHARHQRLGDKLFGRSWTQKEYEVLFDLKDTKKVSEMLGRTWMSVDIRRGFFMPTFLDWAREKNVDIINGEIKSLIQRFLKDKQHEIETRKFKKKQIKALKEEYDSWPKRERWYKILLAGGSMKQIEFDKKKQEREAILQTIKNIEDDIES